MNEENKWKHEKPQQKSGDGKSAEAQPVAATPAAPARALTPAQHRLRAQLDAAAIALVATATPNGGARGKKVHLVADGPAWELIERLRAALGALEDAEST